MVTDTGIGVSSIISPDIDDQFYIQLTQEINGLFRLDRDPPPTLGF